MKFKRTKGAQSPLLCEEFMSVSSSNHLFKLLRILRVAKREGHKGAEGSNILKVNHKRCLLPFCPAHLTLRWVAFHSPGIDGQDVFPRTTQGRGALFGQKLAWSSLKSKPASSEAQLKTDVLTAHFAHSQLTQSNVNF